MRGDSLILPAGCYVTVLEADVSPNAKNVKIFIDIFGQNEIHDKIIKKLNEAEPHFRFQLAKKIDLRVVPELEFILDKTGDYAVKIESLIAQEKNAEAGNGKKNRKPRKK